MADMVADWLKDDLSKIETATEENQDWQLTRRGEKCAAS